MSRSLVFYTLVALWVALQVALKAAFEDAR